MTLAIATADSPWPLPLKPQIEAALDRFLPSADTQPEPLHRALRYAVFAEGKRLRPQLLLHVAAACGASASDADLAMRAACAVELVHIASLAHDDLPCFENTSLRRGRPTVHALYGEAHALLVGDALLTHSFDLLLSAPRAQATRALRIGQLLARAASTSCGLGGGFSSAHDAPACVRPAESAARYHAIKSGALFAMAAESGAMAAGSRRTEDWARVGRLVSQGYQLVHALRALPSLVEPVAGGSGHGAAYALLPQPRVMLQQQLATLAATLHGQIGAMAVRAQPLLDFLAALYVPLLPGGSSHPATTASSASGFCEHGSGAAAFPSPSSVRK